MSFLAGLNASQCRAVDHHEGPLLVVAGAGSGECAVGVAVENASEGGGEGGGEGSGGESS